MHRKLASAVRAFHLLWIVLMIVGIPLSILCDWYEPIHWVVIGTTIVSQIVWLGCPLSTLEQALRRKYDPDATYTGSFVCHYLRKRFGIEVPPIVVTLQLLVFVVVAIAISV